MRVLENSERFFCAAIHCDTDDNGRFDLEHDEIVFRRIASSQMSRLKGEQNSIVIPQKEFGGEWMPAGIRVATIDANVRESAAR